MMVIKHVRAPVTAAVGAHQDILIWDFGVSAGRVVAVHMLSTGEADLVVEFDVPAAVDVPDDLCARVGACRWDASCPFLTSCEAGGE